MSASSASTWTRFKGNLAAPFVIALARVKHGEIVVVSEEDFGRKESPRIPDVCRAEGIRCYKLADFIEALGWRF